MYHLDRLTRALSDSLSDAGPVRLPRLSHAASDCGLLSGWLHPLLSDATSNGGLHYARLYYARLHYARLHPLLLNSRRRGIALYSLRSGIAGLRSRRRCSRLKTLSEHWLPRPGIYRNRLPIRSGRESRHTRNRRTRTIGLGGVGRDL